MGAVGQGRGGQIVLGVQPRVDELLAGVVDEFPRRVGEVDVAAARQLHVPADLLDAGKAHVHQQHAAVGAALPGQLHIPAQRHHPAEVLVRVGEEALDVGGGKMQVLHLVQRRLIPVGGGGVRPLLQGGEGGARHQRAPAVEHGDGDQLVPVLLVQQLHPLVQALGGKVGVLMMR